MRTLFTGLLLGLTAAAGHAQQPDFTPAWSKGVVWYQIFPERFRNGDPHNDPTARDQRGAYPFNDSSAFQIHPWGSDWYELQPYERQNGQPVGYNIQRRRYGGDLQGIINQLDYLQRLGVNALYLTPIFWSPSSHKYDALCYHHVDPTFGPDPAGDERLMTTENPLRPETWVWTKADLLALQLIDEVHRRGMHIIFDGVFNHLGARSFAFQDVEKNQQASPYADWFTVRSWRDPARGTKFEYEGWFGVKTLPELREDSAGIVAGPRQYIFNATQRWMNPMNRGAAHGIDGWRLDVAYNVAHPFWKSWRRWVRQLNPQAFLTAELVDPIDKTRPYLRGDEFDATMNYNFAFAVHDFFVQERAACTVTQFDQRLRELREAFGPNVALNMQNLVDSHDATRIGTAVANPDGKAMRDWGAYFNWSQKGNNPTYNVRRPTSAQRQRQQLIAAFQLLYLGSPMIFYGDEAGLWGGNDPDCRKPMLWPDLTYSPETHNPDQTRHAPDAVAFDAALFAWYQKFIGLRQRSAALRQGSFSTVATDDARQLYAFRRTLEREDVLVVLNRGPKPATFSHAVLGTRTYRDAFTQAPAPRQLTVPANGLLVLRAE